MPEFDPSCLTRIFILGGKGVSEQEWEEKFSRFGSITKIWVTKDRNTNEDKGITYITYSKTSEACKAIEEMNGEYLPQQSRPLKVILASDRREGSRRNADEDKMLLRLFIKVSRDATQEDIRHDFEQFGEIDYIRILNDRHTGKSKGLAYVKYYKQSHGALAFEECDPKYKAIYADANKKEEANPMDFGYLPPPDSGYSRGGSDHRSSAPQRYGPYHEPYERRDRMGPPSGGYGNEPAPGPGPMDLVRNYNSWVGTRLEALVPEMLSQDHVQRLFDLVPGLKHCRYDRITGMCDLEYSSSQCASYAKDKLDGFEYPPGYRISVRVPSGGGAYGGENRMSNTSDFGNMASQITQMTESTMATRGSSSDVMGNISSLVESIQKATEVLQTAGINAGSMGLQQEENVRWCNLPLPMKKPFAPRDAPVEERLFIVSMPESFPDSFLEDALCRFGGLISAYFMPGKTYGYAKFADKAGAEKAVQVLHGQSIYGMRVKVMLADPPKYAEDGERNNKRQKMQ